MANKRLDAREDEGLPTDALTWTAAVSRLPEGDVHVSNWLSELPGDLQDELWPPAYCANQRRLRPYALWSRLPNFGQRSLVDMPSEAPGLWKQCRGTEIEVRAGDLLYLPRFWWHEVCALDDTVAVNAFSTSGWMAPLTSLATVYRKLRRISRRHLGMRTDAALQNGAAAACRAQRVHSPANLLPRAAGARLGQQAAGPDLAVVRQDCAWRRRGVEPARSGPSRTRLTPSTGRPSVARHVVVTPPTRNAVPLASAWCSSAGADGPQRRPLPTVYPADSIGKPMTPHAFVAKWKSSQLTERAGSQSHFIDLCNLLGVDTPSDGDPTGATYAFERGAKKVGGGDGWADVWKKGCFAWEYKGKHKDLTAAYAQLLRYAVALENPPLLVVSDMETIIVRTNFTNTVQEAFTWTLEDLASADKRSKLKRIFEDPEHFRPGQTTTAITEDAASAFAALADILRNRGQDPMEVAHFLQRLLFCLFAEDAGLLPDKLFSRVLKVGLRKPAHFHSALAELFKTMSTGGMFGADDIDWFNGGLFDSASILPLEPSDLVLLTKVAKLDWSLIEPAIIGTLFERGLDPSKRSQLGAHYTDKASIASIVGPVVIDPLWRQWEALEPEIAADMTTALAAGPKAAPAAKATASKARKRAEELYNGFLDQLRAVRVLDPACGSGNFLYVALQSLKDLEHRVMLAAEALGLPMGFPQLGPEVVLGIEVNPYAAELARVTIWIGEIQWMRQHGLSYSKNPVLKNLEQIRCADAVLTDSGLEPDWPAATCIIGNPPFLGDKKLLRGLGDDYVARLRVRYDGRVPGGADLVAYWFEKARAQLESGNALRAGLVTTNSIRGGKNRTVLDRIAAHLQIWDVWPDEPWVNDGASVRVSRVCFARPDSSLPVRFRGQPVAGILPDLTAAAEGTEAGDIVDLTKAQRLAENAGVSFIGVQKGGNFQVPGDVARKWLQEPNPHGKPNSDVLKPIVNGVELTRGPADRWIIDFGVDRPVAEAALYEGPFQHCQDLVKPVRSKARAEREKERWWLHQRSRPEMRQSLAPLSRFVATPRVSKHRVFAWLECSVLLDSAAVAVARDDDTTFGILHSRFHEAWTLRLCTWLGVGNDPRYTPTTTFETFPFPSGLEPTRPAAEYANDPRAMAIAQAAAKLCSLRDTYLTPPEWVERQPEVVAGYPDRVVPKTPALAKELKKRHLTELYNRRPQWLITAHQELDAAVAAAYGWPADVETEDALRELLALNLARVGEVDRGTEPVDDAVDE